MTNQDEAIEFYESIVSGKDYSRSVALEANGRELEGFEMHVVPKEGVADVVNRLPDEMFEQANVEGLEVEDDVEPEDLEQEMEGTTGIAKETVEAFEDLCMTSLRHQNLSKSQIADIIEEFDFEVLFELGSEILDMSVEKSGKIKDFRVQS